jgi:hypothetical protein
MGPHTAKTMRILKMIRDRSRDCAIHVLFVTCLLRLHRVRVYRRYSFEHRQEIVAIYRQDL